MLARLRLFVALIAATVALTGCFGGSGNQYGISWSQESGGSATAQSLHATATAGLNDSATASGYWIPDPNQALGETVDFRAWTEDASGNRTYTPAQWSLSNPGLGSLSPSGAASYVRLDPTKPGTAEVKAVIDGTVVTDTVTIYPGFVLETTPGFLMTKGGIGFIFSTGTYTSDTSQADIWIAWDGSKGVVQVPGGFVASNATYLHEVTSAPSMSGSKTSFPTWDAITSGYRMTILTTRAGKHVAVAIGVAGGSSATDTIIVAGYRLLD